MQAALKRVLQSGMACLPEYGYDEEECAMAAGEGESEDVEGPIKEGEELVKDVVSVVLVELAPCAAFQVPFSPRKTCASLGFALKNAPAKSSAGHPLPEEHGLL